MAGFIDFLEDWGVIGLAVAVIIGGKLNAWVSSLVDHIMMPLIGLLLPGGEWRNFSLAVGEGNELLIGQFLGATLDFLIVSFVIYVFFTKVYRSETAIETIESTKTDR